jgi:hypothetical protein
MKMNQKKKRKKWELPSRNYASWPPHVAQCGPQLDPGHTVVLARIEHGFHVGRYVGKYGHHHLRSTFGARFRQKAVYHGHRTLPPDMAASLKKSYGEHMKKLGAL